MLQNIKKFCRERNISIAELEREVGIGVNAIYKWDTLSPSISRVAKVAEVLGVTIDELITDKEAECR